MTLQSRAFEFAAITMTRMQTECSNATRAIDVHVERGVACPTVGVMSPTDGGR